MGDKKDIKGKDHIDMKKLKRKAAILILIAFLFLCAVFFLPAWSLNYWQAWVYIAELFIPMFFFMAYLFKHDPELLMRRIKMKEQIKEQKRIIRLSYLVFLAAYVLPGLDVRYGWSDMPLWVIIIGEILVLTGYLMTVSVLKHNSYASRIIEVQKGQKVITTGPYAIVRHPMYTSVLLMYTASPLALGSYFALIPAFFIIVVIVARIFNEERVLKRDLDGYVEYTHKVRYRLIPGIW